MKNETLLTLLFIGGIFAWARKAQGEAEVEEERAKHFAELKKRLEKSQGSKLIIHTAIEAKPAQIPQEIEQPTPTSQPTTKPAPKPKAAPAPVVKKEEGLSWPLVRVASPRFGFFKPGDEVILERADTGELFNVKIHATHQIKQGNARRMDYDGAVYVGPTSNKESEGSLIRFTHANIIDKVDPKAPRLIEPGVQTWVRTRR